MADNDKATKDEEFATMLEKFGDRFPTSEDYEALTDYITGVNEGVDADDIPDMRKSAIADLEELKETWETVRDQIDELIKFGRENFK